MSAPTSAPAATFDMAQYYTLFLERGLPLTVRVHTDLPIRTLSAQQPGHLPAGYELRIGACIPNTDTYQIASWNSDYIMATAESADLDACVNATDETRALESNPQAANRYTVKPDFRGNAALGSKRQLKIRSMDGTAFTFAGGLTFHVGEAAHLAGCGVAMLTEHLEKTLLNEERVFYPISQDTLQGLISSGQFDYANGNPVPVVNLPGYDTTANDIEKDFACVSNAAFTGCGTRCQAVQVNIGERFVITFKGDNTPLAWCTNAAGEIFVHDLATLLTKVSPDLEALAREKDVASWPDQKQKDMTKAGNDAMAARGRHPLLWEDEEQCLDCGGFFKQHRDNCESENLRKQEEKAVGGMQ